MAMIARSRQSKTREDKLDAILRALADRTRRALVERLIEGEARVTDLAAPFGVSLNAISKHIKALERSGLVRRRIDGRVHYIGLSSDALNEAKEWITTTQTFWSRRFDALEAAVQRSRKGKNLK